MKNNPAVRISAAAMRMVPIADLIPYANNAKIHGPAQIAKLRASLREFGFVSPVLIDGGDYERFDYPEGCVVIDNPPFSILSQICRTYEARGIPFFLFAPTLTLFSAAGGTVNYLPTAVPVVYENGACVNTSFVTNLGDCKIEMAPDLYEAVSVGVAAVRAEWVNPLARYSYPPHLLSVGDFDIVKYGARLRLSASDVAFIRALDAQREEHKTIYGAGFLLSEKAAAEKAAAEKAAAEKAAAEKAAAEKAAAETWQLSEREWEIVHSLGRAKS